MNGNTSIFASGAPLVSTDWLAERIGKQDVAVIDGSWYLPAMQRDPKGEYAAGHIPGATLHPLSVFDPAALPKSEPGKRVVLHCRSGRRTLAALEAAQAAGRDDIRAHFGGGMLEWAGAGEKVV